MTSQKVIELELSRLSELQELEDTGATGLIGSLVSDFSEHAPLLLIAVQQGFATRDHDAIRFACHSMKSSSGALGAKDLSEACGRLEEAATARTEFELLQTDLLALPILLTSSLHALKAYASKSKAA
jgi:HPt (histidine-containing phosphotransfer) domain-containing protein